MLEALEAAGIILDVSHLAEQAFWEAIEIFTGPVLATHNCCRAPVRPRPPARRSTDQSAGAARRRHWHGHGRLDDLSPVGPDRDGQHRHHAGDCGGPHRPRLPANRELPPRRHRHRPWTAATARSRAPPTSTPSPTCGRFPPSSKNAVTRRPDVADIMHGNWVRLLRAAW